MEDQPMFKTKLWIFAAIIATNLTSFAQPTIDASN